jgi:predicted nucleotidyltransferase
MFMDEKQVSEILEELKRRIIEVSQPSQIILFGSYARGTSTPTSDIDLLVIKDDVDSPRDEAGKIYRALADLKVPVDVVVVRSRDVDRYRGLVGTVLRPALSEGRMIYAR